MFDNFKGFGSLFRRVPAIAGVAGLAACVSNPCFGQTAPLSKVSFSALAAHCAPSVSEATLFAVAKTESGFNPLALHDNTTGTTTDPASIKMAEMTATEWINRGDSVDVGLMQINSYNFSALGITAATALDACVSLSAGAEILSAAYGITAGNTKPEAQVALLLALSKYNTGSPIRGILNGYARRVENNIPSSQQIDTIQLSEQNKKSEGPPPPPAWQVWPTAAYDQKYGANWLVPFSPASVKLDGKEKVQTLASPARTDLPKGR